MSLNNKSNKPEQQRMTAQDLNDILFNALDLQTSIEERLWNIANALRSNSTLKASEYATPVLGLIFLKYASNKFQLATPIVESEIEKWDEEEDIKKLYIAECGKKIILCLKILKNRTLH